MHSLDQVLEEPEWEIQVEQSQAEETNPELAQVKPWCIPPQSLTCILNHHFMINLIVH
jgi:hypothetical protein